MLLPSAGIELLLKQATQFIYREVLTFVQIWCTVIVNIVIVLVIVETVFGKIEISAEKCILPAANTKKPQVCISVRQNTHDNKNHIKQYRLLLYSLNSFFFCRQQ